MTLVIIMGIIKRYSPQMYNIRGGFSGGVQEGAHPQNFLAPPQKNSKMACIL